MRRLVAVLALLLLAGCATWSGPPPAPFTVPYGSSAHTLRVDGLDRTFRTYRPRSTAGARALPLVLVLHGSLGSGRQAEQAYGWNATADRDGFLVAYPDGVDRTWNGPAADDIAFVADLVAAVGAAAPVNLARVYATGISSGATLAYRLACVTTLLAAIAPVAGTLAGPCPDPQPISVLHIHGTADKIIPYGGGPGPSALELAGFWRRVDDCPRPRFSTSGLVTTTTAICPGGHLVVLKAISGAGHQWPGAGAPGAAQPGAAVPGPAAPGPVVARLRGLDPPAGVLDATAAIASFFRLS
ncbi:MAG TPA: PHB depolymerase family esterase [Actinoplanes sp.]|nr:PHB depolymerase family esterase [Actinoplanes sp.]